VRCVCGCRGRAVHRHHAVYEQEVRRHGGDVRDPRNLVPVTFACHGAHHGRSRPLPLRVLPDAVFEFAAELMGPAAYDYLGRYYSGRDPRHDALLS
jgi:hypothetical protein